MPPARIRANRSKWHESRGAGPPHFDSRGPLDGGYPRESRRPLRLPPTHSRGERAARGRANARIDLAPPSAGGRLRTKASVSPSTRGNSRTGAGTKPAARAERPTVEEGRTTDVTTSTRCGLSRGGGWPRVAKPHGIPPNVKPPTLQTWRAIARDRVRLPADTCRCGRRNLRRRAVGQHVESFKNSAFASTSKIEKQYLSYPGCNYGVTNCATLPQSRGQSMAAAPLAGQSTCRNARKCCFCRAKPG